MNDELFYLTVRDFRGQQLIALTGRADTVIEAALRVILDSAPNWRDDQGRMPRPLFQIDCVEVAKPR